MAERYKLGDIDNERFYQVPKSLFINPKYKSMSNTSKIMYAILKDRMELSRKNGWHDENDDIFLLFDQQDMADLLATSRVTINRNMKELKDAGLIEPIRQGLGKPNKIYINKPAPYHSEHQEVTKTQHQDVSKMLHQNVSEFNSSDTEGNETEISDTKNTIYTPKPPKETKISFAEAVSMTQKEYDKLKEDIGSDDGVKWCIEKLNNYKLSSGKKYKNDYRAILSWVKESYVKANKQVNGNKPSGIRVNAKWGDYDG